MAWNPLTRPGFLINRIFRLMSQYTDMNLQSLDLGSAGLPVMMALKMREEKGEDYPITQADLANWMMVEQASMAQLLARLERDGHISRTQDKDDKRRRLIHLTDKGRAALPHVVTQLNVGNEILLANFSKEEAEIMLRLLHKMMLNCEAALPSAFAWPHKD